MKVAIVGSRDYPHLNEVETYVRHKLAPVAATLVSGGARGVDSVAEREARKLGLQCFIFRADWELHGKSAGYIRNHDIVANCDRLVAFWDGESKGTKHSIDLALEMKKTLEVIFS